MPHQAAAAGEAPAAQPPAAVTAGTARGGAGLPPGRPRRAASRALGGAGGDSRLPGGCCMRGNKAPARGGAGPGWAGQDAAPLPSGQGRAGPGGLAGPGSRRALAAVPGAGLPLAGGGGGPAARGR